jgi:predicted nucleotidyltransferase
MNLPGVKDGDLKILVKILTQHLEKHNCKVFAFGSRTLHEFRKNSDLDLLVRSESVIPASVWEELRFDLEESDLPFRVDLLNERGLSQSVLTSIKRLSLQRIY